jgi:hypothetical protein
MEEPSCSWGQTPFGKKSRQFSSPWVPNHCRESSWHDLQSDTEPYLLRARKGEDLETLLEELQEANVHRHAVKYFKRQVKQVRAPHFPRSRTSSSSGNTQQDDALKSKVPASWIASNIDRHTDPGDTPPQSIFRFAEELTLRDLQRKSGWRRGDTSSPAGSLA